MQSIILKLEQYLTENYALPKAPVAVTVCVSVTEKKEEKHLPPPPDDTAKRVKQSYKDLSSLPPIPIFFDDSTKQHSPFLSNLASAITTISRPSQIYDITSIEKENRWENLFKDSSIKFILIPDLLLWKSPHLITYYREIPGQLLKKLANFPLFILQDIDAFYKTPELKASLWNVLSQHLRR